MLRRSSAAPMRAFALTLIFAFAHRVAAQQPCKGRQSYIFRVTTSFTPNVDPTIPEQRAAIPVMVAVAHKKDFSLFGKTQFLTDEVAEVVTASTTEKIVPYLKEWEKNKTISSWKIIAEGRQENITVQGKSEFDLRFRDDASFVSILAPLSPSPAWFIGATKDLCSGGSFVPAMNNLKFENFDAGLMKGSTFESNTDPVEEGEREPVTVVQDKKDLLFATMELKKGSLDTDSGAFPAPSAENTTEPSATPDCFPASATVELADGSVKTMADLKVGDRVKVAHPATYSDVFFFSHNHATARGSAIRLETSADGGAGVTLSPGHLVYASGKLRPAHSVRVGDTVAVRGASSTVTQVQRVVATGKHNPHTLHGDIVVDGVLVSTYTAAVHPVVARALLVPFRMAYRAAGAHDVVLMANRAVLRMLGRFYWR